MPSKRIRVAIVGLGFGAEFIPIYQSHPDAEMYAICRRNERELNACGDRFGIKKRYRDFNELLLCVQAQQAARTDLLRVNVATMGRLAREICGECVPRQFAPALRTWMDQIQRLSSDIAQI